MEYPHTRKDESVRDDYFGTVVEDPYRWLENDRAQETADWVTRQNLFTERKLSEIPYRNDIRRRLEALYRYERRGIPVQNGEYLYFFRNRGTDRNNLLCREPLNQPGEIETVIDPADLAPGETCSILSFHFSPDERYIAFVLTYSGSDWNEIRVYDLRSERLLSEAVRHVKFCEPAWTEDGFYYTRYEVPETGELFTGSNLDQKVWFHPVGRSQREDRLVYEDPQHPRRYYHPYISPDGRWMLIVCSEGTSGDSVLYRRIGDEGPFLVLFEGFAHDFRIVHCENDTVFLHTNLGADTFRLISVDLASGSGPSEVIPAAQETLTDVTVGGGSLFAHYLENACTRILQYSPSGDSVREIGLPGRGTAAGMSGKKGDTALWYTYTDFITPPSVFRYDLPTGTSSVIFRPTTAFDPEKFVTEQLYYPGTDGTPVPMFLVCRKGYEKNGDNPLLLYGYGGFNISLTPSFTPENLLFVENGGIYALANIRGGGEYGERWHKAGMLENKQQVFDDFIAAAEFLIAERFTSPAKLAISGGSNGGLLVGACMTQRPDLFAAAVPRVGVLDMLRYHRFTCGWGWIVEYGSPEEEASFDYLVKYSPLHNVRNGTCYPATFIMTADHDDRVVPAHSFKFAAALQEKQACDRPVLIRIEADAGHGAGKPLDKSIAGATDFLSFIFYHTGTVLPERPEDGSLRSGLDLLRTR